MNVTEWAELQFSEAFEHTMASPFFKGKEFRFDGAQSWCDWRRVLGYAESRDVREAEENRNTVVKNRLACDVSDINSF